MMGSAATSAAAEQRKADDRAYREAKRQIELETYKARQDAKLAVKLSRAETESARILIPTQAQAASDAVETDARAKFVRALPWIVGGAVAVAAVVFLRKRK